MNYKPNFLDPRVLKRTKIALNWCDFHLHEKRPRAASKNDLDKVFGSSGKSLSDYLRNLLIVDFDKSYSVGNFSKKYLLNKIGYAELERIVSGKEIVPNSPKEDFMSFFDNEYGNELNSLIFNMKESSHRLWHPLQNISRNMKEQFWKKSGLPYDYDIEACAPTILFQLAEKARLPGIIQEPVRAYLDDRNGFRMYVSELTGLSINDSKRLINSFFNGAKLAANGYCSAFRLLEYDVVLMEKLKNDLKIKSLRRNISNIWKRLEMIERHKQIVSCEDFLNGKIAPIEKKLKTSRQKWNLYFEHERKILDVIIGELNRKGIRFFTEHDGFRSEERIDIDFFQEKIYEKTGLRIILKENSTMQQLE